MKNHIKRYYRLAKKLYKKCDKNSKHYKCYKFWRKELRRKEGN